MSQPDITDRLDELEAQLNDQQEIIERQQEQLEEQDAIIRDQRERLGEEATPASEAEPAEPEATDENTESPGPIATRRGVLTSAGVLGLLGLGAGTASADASGQIGTSTDPLQELHTANLYGDSGSVTVKDNLDLNGKKLVDGNGITFERNDLASSQENNVLTVGASGNVGLSDNVSSSIGGGGSPSSLVTSNSGTTALEVSDYGSSPNVVGGDPNNSLYNDPKGATVSGGGGSNDYNHAKDNYASIGGGAGNIASDFAATVAGGYKNEASGGSASVPGGRYNRADGSESFAAGRLAEAADMRSFVWNDGKPRTSVTSTHGDGLSSANAVSSETVTGSYTFSASAANGFRFITGGDTSPSVVTIDDDGSQNAQLQSWSGGLSVTTNDMGNLTLDPGANYELNLSNQTTGSSGSLLAIDGSGNVVEASGTTLSDVGGTPSSLVTNGNAVTSMEVFEGGTGSAISGTSDGATPPNVIGGHPSNNTGGKDVKGATIAGGGGNTAWPWDNEASAAWATVGGGKHNTASNSYATVSGGEDNTADGKNSTVPGGLGGAAEDDFSFVWNDGITHHSIPNSDTDGLSSSTAVDNETVTGSHTFSVSAKNGFRFITGSATNPNVTYIDSSGKLVSSGGVDAQGGTVENTTGALSLSTSSGDLDLQPSGNIDLNSNRISNAKEIHSDSNNITFKGTADVNLDGTRLTEKGGDMNIASTNSVNVDIDNDSNDSDGTRDFNVTKDGGSTTLFTVNDGGQVDIFQGDLDMNSSGSVINTSDVRLKTAIEPIANPVEKLTALEPRTYEWKDDEAADGREAGVLAQSVEDTLPEAVKEDEDGFLKLAYSQLTPLVISAVQDQ